MTALFAATCGGLFMPRLFALGSTSPSDRPNFGGRWVQTSWVQRWRQGDVAGTVDPGVGPLGVSVTIEQTETSLTVDRAMTVSRNNGLGEQVTVRQVFSFDGTEIAGRDDDSCYTRHGSWQDDTFVAQARTSDPVVGPGGITMQSCGPKRSTMLALRLKSDGSLYAASTSSGGFAADFRQNGLTVTATYRRDAPGAR